MIIDPHDREVCVCGGRGCLEVLVSEKRLLVRAAEQKNRYPDSLLFAEKKPEDVTSHEIFTSAQKGDPAAREVLEGMVDAFATAVSNVTVTCDPEMVVITGTYVQGGEYFLQLLRRRVQERALCRIKRRVAVTFSSLGSEGVVLGASHFVVTDYLNRTFADES